MANLKAEKIFLNLLVKENNLLNYIDIITIEYFTTISTQNVFNGIKKLFINNYPINEATLEQASKEKIDWVFSTNNDKIETYFNIIKSDYIKRELTTLANTINTDKTAEQLLISTQQTLDKLTLNQTTDTSGSSLIYEALKATKEAYHIRNKFGLSGISMIHPDVDAILQGLKPGTLNILAARPSTGKSLYGIHIFINNALINLSPSLMVSLEMKKEKVGQRIISNLLNVKFSALDTGYLSKEDLLKIYAPKTCKNCNKTDFASSVNYLEYTVENICKSCGGSAVTALDLIHNNNTLLLNEKPGLNLFQVMSTIKSHKMKHNDLNFVLIDHMGEINESGSKESEENRLARITKSLRDLARELNITILLLCQLNRDMEKEEREPRSSDLRGSGRIEEHADTIIMLYRDIQNNSNVVKCLVTKNRNGITGVCYIPLDLEYQRVLKTKAQVDII